MDGPTHYMHDDVIQRKHFSRYWPIVRGIHRSSVNSPHKGRWRGLWCFLSSEPGRVNNRKSGDLRCHRAHYEVIVMRLLTIHNHTIYIQCIVFHLLPFWNWKAAYTIQIMTSISLVQTLTIVLCFNMQTICCNIIKGAFVFAPTVIVWFYLDWKSF